MRNIMKKENAVQLTNDLLIADALIRIKSIENLLIKNGILTQDQITEEMKNVSEIILKMILEKSKIPGDIDKLLKDLIHDGDDKIKN